MQALNSDNCFNLRALKQLADKGCYCILDDCADGCPSMHRLKRASAQYAGPSTRLMYNEHQTCTAHQLHNAIKASFGESDVVGNAHAVSYVFALHSRRKQLEGALKHLVHVELECIEGRPPLEYVRHARSIVDATILRHESYIGARSGVYSGGDVFRGLGGLGEEATGNGNGHEGGTGAAGGIGNVHEPCCTIATPADALTHANGNLAVARITHWCAGCCTNELGLTTREIQERNMVAALRLLLGFLFTGQKPALSRWLSTGRMLAYLTCGFFFYSILPRVWRLAFGEGEVPAKLQDLGDWKVYCKSKVRRVCLWFAQEETSLSVALFSFGAMPAEHLLQLIQSLDHAGSILRDIARTRTNMFWECLRTYASMVLPPLVPALEPFWTHFAGQGRLVSAVASRVLWGAVLHIAATIWRKLAMPYDSFPYKLVGLVMDDDVLFDEALRGLNAASECCLDTGISVKVRSLVQAAGNVVPHGLLAALRTWSRHSRITNMCTERLISRLMRRAPRRSDLARFVSTAYLGEVDYIHKGVGGADVRGNTRRQLNDMKVPLKCSAQSRRGRRKHGVSAMGKFHVWAAAKQRERREILKGGQRGRHGNRSNYREVMRELSAAWRSGDTYVAAAAVDDDEIVRNGPSYSDKIGNDLWGISSPDSPVCPKVLHEEGCRITGRSAGFGVCALKPARDDFLRAVIVRDEGCIPDAWKPTCHKPCCLRHPGFCVKTMQGKPLFWSCHSDLCVALGALARGTFISIRWHHGCGENQKLFAIANTDDANNVVLVRCDADPLLFLGVCDDVEPPSVRTIAGRGFDFVMAQTVLQEVQE